MAKLHLKSKHSSKHEVDPEKPAKVRAKERKSHRAAIDGMGVLKDAIKKGGIRESNEAKASRTTCGLVTHDYSLKDLAIIPEVLLELLLRRLPRNPTDEQLPLVRIHPLPSRKPKNPTKSKKNWIFRREEKGVELGAPP